MNQTPSKIEKIKIKNMNYEKFLKFKFSGHKPKTSITRIIGTKSYGNPSTRRYSNCVPFNRVNKVEFLRISLRIVIPYSPTNSKEIESM
jgi:protein tyrosine phosphatase